MVVQPPGLPFDALNCIEHGRYTGGRMRCHRSRRLGPHCPTATVGKPIALGESAKPGQPAVHAVHDEAA